MEGQSTAQDYSKFFIPVSIIVAGVIVGGGLYLGLSKSGGSPGQGTQPTANVDIKDVKTEGAPFIGKPDAKVVLAYWFDYQCPYCKAVDVGGIPQIPIEPALPALIKDYVDTGKLKIVFKDYAFLGPDSTTAALYKNAVWKLHPGKFYEWHEAMFRAQDEENGGFGDEASIVALMKKIPGMDAAKVKADVAANKVEYQKRIDADRAEGSAFGINGTPGFITGKTLIPGAAEISSFTQAIDPQLK
ncbi:thioredoxin domain-containing protein [Candidatus Kaiserbacteria bacterium]|nr:thioredoxin domain-containing protein [Candidatus Kaiserbacteria bacterium]